MMSLSRPALILIAMAGSAALLLGALAFQRIGGLAPCELCLWQRYPHGVAIVVGILALMAWRPVLAWLGAAACSTLR